MNAPRNSAPAGLALFGGGTMLGAAATIKKGDTIFQRYVLRRVLGVGGMGVVWLANDAKLDEEVALKFVPDALGHDQDAIQDLKNQTKLGLKLTHENIVRVQGFENDDTLAAIVMEFVDGATLASMRVDKPSQVFEADTLHIYLLGILAALEYAHEKAGIVHRDLKPANVMVDSQDRLKVADFGIACSLRNSVGRVMSMPQHTGSGTLHYMSPQQLLGGPGCVADDIYSLGASVFELMTGTPPFHSGDLSTQIREIPAVSMTTRRQQGNIEGEVIPTSWEEVVAAALEKDAMLRPSNVDEFRKGLLGHSFKRGTG
ncbi:MAG: Serine/threonine protein kinase, partial [Verrucomicrobiaceae bacterium]|nr:Serine/threonine protein kinase [Verrucomicrobiaceae bacterium]